MSISLPDSLRRDMTNTARQMNELFHRMDRFLPPVVSEMFPLATLSDFDGTVHRNPTVTVTHEDDKEMHLSMEMPGVNKENLLIEYTGKTLRWSAHNEYEKVQKDGSKTKSVHDFSGMYRLPYIPQGVSAKLDNGVLAMVVTKPESVDDASISVSVS